MSTRPARWPAEVRAIIASVALSYGAAYLGFFAPLERLMFDMLQSFERRSMEQIHIVDVTDDDFDKLFRRQRPLNAELLHCALLRVAAAQPRTIAVDIETTLSQLTAAELALAPSSCAEFAADPRALASRLVWAVDAWPASPVTESRPNLLQSLRGLTRDAELGAPLTIASALPLTGTWGLAGLAADHDGVVRRYERWREVTDRGFADSLPTAIARNYCRAISPSDEAFGAGMVCDELRAGHPIQSAHEVLIDFAGPSAVFHSSLSTVNDAARSPNWSRSSPLRGKVVVFGGTFRDAREVQFSPIGPIAGVDLMAQAAASEIDGRRIPESHGVNLIIDTILAVGSVLLTRGLSRLRGFWRAAVPIVVMIAIVTLGWLALYWARLALLSVPALFFSLWLHQRHAHPTASSGTPHTQLDS